VADRSGPSTALVNHSSDGGCGPGAIDAAKLQLTYTKVHRPISGRVGLRLWTWESLCIPPMSQSCCITQVEPYRGFLDPQTDLRLDGRDGSSVQTFAFQVQAYYQGNSCCGDRKLEAMTTILHHDGTFKLTATFGQRIAAVPSFVMGASGEDAQGRHSRPDSRRAARAGLHVV